ncbi:MAG: hypothetical protein RL510_868 [Actinomycetota bacterium]
MAKRLQPANSVAVAAAMLGDFDVAGFTQVLNDRSGMPLCNANLGGELAQLYVWVFGQLHDHVPVIAEESPTHIETIAELE